jgi:Leucine-rich repeat (LRR) protein
LKLEILDVSYNRLTEVILPTSDNQLTSNDVNIYNNDNELSSTELNHCNNINELREIYLSNNLFTTFNYHKLNPTILTRLNLDDNNLESTDLTVFSHLINLEKLSIGNYDQERIEQGIYNRFHGSLKPLQKSTELTFLSICNTDINAGLEYLIYPL